MSDRPKLKTIGIVLGLAIIVGVGVVTFDLWADASPASETQSGAPSMAVSEPENVPRPGTSSASTTSAEQTTAPTTSAPMETPAIEYVEVVDSCDHSWQGECVTAVDAPSFSAATTSRLRTDMVLRVDGRTSNEEGVWYRLSFDNQFLRYPDRIESDWFVSAADVNLISERGVRTTWEDKAPTTTDKRIVIDKSEQRLYAYEGDTLFLETAVSTGLDLSPTTLGTFEVFKKMPSRYMQGPIEDAEFSEEYDLSGVPWNLYFTEAGEVIHGAYWHESFGQRYSHGCVNLPPDVAERLYEWTPLTTTVMVRN